MNRIALLTLALAAAGISSAALAQTQPAPASHPAHEHGDAMHRGMAMGRHGGKHRRGHDGGIARLDANQDGRIARAELAGKGRRMAQLETQFDAIDGNRDGYLVRTELQVWRQARRSERQAQRTKMHAQHFAAADLNRDGKLSKVEVSEKMPRMAKTFAWLDNNRDGFLSREELAPRRQR